jgi:hypothetical protein
MPKISLLENQILVLRTPLLTLKETLKEFVPTYSFESVMENGMENLFHAGDDTAEPEKGTKFNHKIGWILFDLDVERGLTQQEWAKCCDTSAAMIDHVNALMALRQFPEHRERIFKSYSKK